MIATRLAVKGRFLHEFRLQENRHWLDPAVYFGDRALRQQASRPLSRPNVELQWLISAPSQSKIGDYTGPDCTINLLAHRYWIEGPERDWPASSDRRLKLLNRDRTQAQGPAHQTILRQPIREAQVPPPPAGSPSVVDEVPGLHAPSPEVGKRGDRSLYLDGMEMARVGRQDVTPDPTSISPGTAVTGQL